MLRGNIESVIERTKKFYDLKSNQSALIHVQRVESFVIPELDLTTYQFPQDMEKYLDDKITCLESFWHQREELDDDHMPFIIARYGIAELSAFIEADAEAEVEFSTETSWHHQAIKSWDVLEKLKFDHQNKWLKLVIDGMKYLQEKNDGRYIVGLRGCECPIDIANALRGNDLFLDFYTNPDEVHRLMDLCADAAIYFLKAQLEVVNTISGGIGTGFELWVPNGYVGHLSEDATTMCSPETYTTFGKPYTEKILKEFDKCLMHTHSIGTHVLPQIAAIEKIDVIEIVNDPNGARAIEIYKQFENVLKGKKVMFTITKSELEENIAFLKDRKTILRYDAKDVADAKEVIEIVRTYLN